MPPDKFYSTKYEEIKKFMKRDIHTANSSGLGAVADDYIEHGIDLNEELIRNKPTTFFMRVNIDAMQETGIYKEDVVIVDRSLKAANGKVIIAILNGDMLIRRFEKINNKVRLLTDSNKLSPINIDANCEDFAIWGVVTYVIHKP